MNPTQANELGSKLGASLANAIALPMLTISGDGAIPVDQDICVYLTKGSAAAITLAVPGASNIGRIIRVLGGSDFAHVVTAASTSVHDGTTGGHGTLTSPAFQGGALTLVAVTAAKWNVVSNNLFVIT